MYRYCGLKEKTRSLPVFLTRSSARESSHKALSYPLYAIKEFLSYASRMALVNYPWEICCVIKKRKLVEKGRNEREHCSAQKGNTCRTTARVFSSIAILLMGNNHNPPKNVTCRQYA